MASRFASVTSEEIIQINDEAFPENTKREIKFGLAVCKGNGLICFNQEFIDKNQSCVTSLVQLKIKVE